MSRPRIVPRHWLVPAAPRRIILHWTAGTHTAAPVDLAHYHIVIEWRAEAAAIVCGRHSIADNDRTSDGRYAAHTRLLNQGSIGVAVCAMGGAIERPYSPGRWPIMPGQWQALYAVCADLCERYGLTPVSRELCSHAEVTRVHGIRQPGKWDISVSPAGDLVTAAEAGAEIRRAVAALLERRPPAYTLAEGAGHD